MIHDLNSRAPLTRLRPPDRYFWRWVVVLFSTWLGGCATNADPHQGGFINGIAGLASGNYQRRVTDREGVYQGELSAGERLRAQAATLEQERLQVRATLDQAQNQLITLEKRIKQERARLASQKQQAAAARIQQVRLAQAQTRLLQTQRQLTSIRPQIQHTTPAQSVDALKQRAQALQHELEAIDDLVGSVAAKGL